MPLHEYHCEPCRRTFEVLVRSLDDVAACPSCGTTDVRKELSAPAPARAAGTSLPVCAAPAPSGFGCGGGQCATGLCGLD